MLWRVRADLPDRPGTLAGLARTCGEAGVDICRLQVLPGAAGGLVTDELVLDAPETLDQAAVARLVADAGGVDVRTVPCTTAALEDQPTRHVEAARAVLANPASFPDVVARLLDADAVPPGDTLDVLDLEVGDVSVQVSRREPFTETERARGLAMAALVSDVLGRTSHGGPTSVDASIVYRVREATVEALAGDLPVGRATLRSAPGHEPGTREVHLVVETAWQRRGIGTRLLGDAARLARAQGADELLVRTRADNQAVMPMVLAAGMRGRIRMTGGELTVRIPLREVRPLAG